MGSSPGCRKPPPGLSDKFLQSAARIICPRSGTNSTLAACKVCSARYTPRRNMDFELLYSQRYRTFLTSSAAVGWAAAGKRFSLNQPARTSAFTTPGNAWSWARSSSSGTVRSMVSAEDGHHRRAVGGDDGVDGDDIGLGLGKHMQQLDRRPGSSCSSSWKVIIRPVIIFWNGSTESRYL